jgi:dienelactone hydrolase
VIETPLQFGSDGHLVGMLTEPGDAPGRPELVFLLCNAGVIPRQGPHRLNVRLARALAAQGQSALRLDLNGHGDSGRARSDDGDEDDPAVADLKAAMDHLQATRGVRRFAVIGICSGAVAAYRLSLADARIAGVLMFDGYWYRTRWSRLVRHWKRMREKSSGQALRAAGGKLARLLGLRPWSESPATNLFVAGNGPSRDEFSAAMQALVQRRTAVFVVYSGSILDYHSYHAQFRHAFAGASWLEQVQCQFRPDIDHSFVTLATQQRMVDLVRDWAPDVQRTAD